MKKRVLVTGANGFIGRHCLEHLQSRGFEIYAVTSKIELPQSTQVHWAHSNLLEVGATKKLMEQIKPSHLLHLAWDVTPGKFWTSSSNLDWVQASLDLLQQFNSAGGKRVVIAGSCTEFDWTWNGTTFNENVPCKPYTLYGASKAGLFQIAQAYCKQVGIKMTWGRIFYLYGPHEYKERFVPSIITRLLSKEPVPCSHGNQIRDFLHVDDVASAFCALLDSDLEGSVNIGAGAGVMLKEIIEEITNELGNKELVQFGALPSPKNDPACLIADVTRLEDELQWKPKYSLQEGLLQTIEWWQSHLSEILIGEQ